MQPRKISVQAREVDTEQNMLSFAGIVLYCTRKKMTVRANELDDIHSCEKLKHHFFEVSFQNERKGCFDAALALVAARRLYLMILRFVEFF